MITVKFLYLIRLLDPSVLPKLKFKRVWTYQREFLLPTVWQGMPIRDMKGNQFHIPSDSFWFDDGDKSHYAIIQTQNTTGEEPNTVEALANLVLSRGYVLVEHKEYQ